MLIDEAEKLSPNSSVVFEVMVDDELLQTSAGAAIATDSLGNEVIYVDPSRATEYMIAHEIMHLVLHRSGWPQMYCIIPENIDPIARRLADEVDNSLDHLTFNPKLEALSFNAEEYQEWFLSVLQDWPATKVTGPDVLWNALKILDALLWGSDFRRRALEITSSKQPESVELARQLQHKASRAKAGTKSSVRLAMIEMMDFLDEWITGQSGSA
jgi:hypothetical protein